MRAAHQGVPIESLPGDTSGGLISSLFNGGVRTSSADPVPPAPVQPTSAAPQQTTGAGLDGWLLNNLFGKR